MKTYLYYLSRYMRANAGRRKLNAFPFLNKDLQLNHEISSAGRRLSLARLYLATNMDPSHPLWRLALGRTDLFHLSNVVRSLPTNKVLTTTIHDLTTLVTPQFHASETIEIDRAFFENVARRTKGLIAVSQNTKKDILAVLKVPDEQVTVIHPGVRDSLFAGDPADGAAVRARWGLARPYILFVGTIEPRKNLGRLLDAYAALKPSLREQFAMVVIGMSGWSDEETVKRLEAEESGVRWLRYVPECDMGALIAGATVLAYPSLYEGFGFPVAEGMATGVPVLTSTGGSLPEVAGGACCLIDPLSQAEMVDALDRLLTSPSERESMIQRGRERAKSFTWQESAAKTWDFFERTAGRL